MRILNIVGKRFNINKNTFWRYVRKKNYSIDYIVNTCCKGGD